MKRICLAVLICLMLTANSFGEIVATDHTFLVSKEGYAANTGRISAYPAVLTTMAELTIGAAITDANSGDTIVVWPGNYAEDVDTTDKMLDIVGTNKMMSVVDGGVASDNAFKLSSGSNLKNFSVSGNYSCGLRPYGNNVIEDCNIFGHGDGIYGNGDNVRFYNCDISGNYDVMQLGGKNFYKIDKCYLVSDCSFSGASACCGIISVGKGTLVNDSAIDMSTSSTTQSIYGISCTKTIGITNCNISLAHSGKVTATSYITCGISANGGFANIKGGNIYISAGRGYIYGIKAITSSKIVVSNITITPPTLSSTTSTVTGLDGTYPKSRFVDSHWTQADDYWNGYWVEFTNGVNSGAKRMVVDFVQSTHTITLDSDLTNEIGNGDAYSFYNYVFYPLYADSTSSIYATNCNYDRTKVYGNVFITDANVTKWAGVTVAAPTTAGLIKTVDPNGKGSATWVQANNSATVEQIAAAVLEDPNHPIKTDSSNNVSIAQTFPAYFPILGIDEYGRLDANNAKSDAIYNIVKTGGIGVPIADDAITSAKFDESTAFPIKYADVNSTKIARTGADADTLETLSDQIDNVEVAAGDPNAIAAKVWDELHAAHHLPGTWGEWIWKKLQPSIFKDLSQE